MLKEKTNREEGLGKGRGREREGEREREGAREVEEGEERKRKDEMEKKEGGFNMERKRALCCCLLTFYFTRHLKLYTLITTVVSHGLFGWGVICISKNATLDILTSSFQQENNLSLTLFISNLIFGLIHGDFVHKALLRFADGIAE